MSLNLVRNKAKFRKQFLKYSRLDCKLSQVGYNLRKEKHFFCAMLCSNMPPLSPPPPPIILGVNTA